MNKTGQDPPGGEGGGSGSPAAQEGQPKGPRLTSPWTASKGQHGARTVAAVTLFAVAGGIATYWATELVKSAGSSYASLSDLVYLVAVAATMTLLVVLAGLHFLDVPSERFARWRVPAAILLAIVSLPLTFSSYFGYGVYAAGAAVVLARRAWSGGRRSAGVVIAGAVGGAALLVGAAMLLPAVGLCGPEILIGICNA